MKVLLINKYFYHIGGIEEFTRSLASIHDQDIKITVLACQSKQNFKDNYNYPANIEIKQTNFSLFNTPISISFIFYLIKYYFSNDIIHVNSPFPVAEVFLFFLSLFKKNKIIITYHSEIIKQKFIFRFLYPFVRGLFIKSWHICVTSPALIKTNLTKGLEKNIKIIPIGQIDRANNFKKDYSKTSFILFVGRLVYYKGLFVLLEAMKSIKFKLKIVGTGPLKNEIIDFIKNHNLGDKIELLTNVDDAKLFDLYKEASFFVFPSIEKTEAFGIVQVQAMSFGLPIINTSLRTGVPWVARNGQEAITVPPGDVSELALTINSLLGNQDLRKYLGENGRKRFKEFFEMNKMLHSYLNLYKEID